MAKQDPAKRVAKKITEKMRKDQGGPPSLGTYLLNPLTETVKASELRSMPQPKSKPRPADGKPRHSAQDPQNRVGPLTTGRKLGKPSMVSGIDVSRNKPKPKAKAKAPAINSPYGPKTSGPGDAPKRKPKPKPGKMGPPAPAVTPAGPQAGPPAPTAKDSARIARKAKRKTAAADLEKRKKAARDKRAGTFNKGGGGTRKVGPGDQSTPGRGGRR
jgi:hypothetical protein